MLIKFVHNCKALFNNKKLAKIKLSLKFFIVYFLIWNPLLLLLYQKRGASIVKGANNEIGKIFLHHSSVPLLDWMENKTAWDSSFIFSSLDQN